MPRSSALDAKALLALGPERLTELLLELAASDPAIKRQLKLAVASSSSPREAAGQVRKRLATIARSRRFLEREQRQLIRKDLTAQLDAITGPIAQRDPAAALDLLWQFLELGDNVLGRCDDSSGLIGDIFRDAIRQLGPIAAAAQPEPLALAERLFEAFCHNGYGVFDDVIQQLAEPLGPVGLAALKQRFQQLGEEPVPVPPREEWEQVGYGSGGPTYAHEREESSRQWTVKLGLQAVAEASGDVDGFIAQYAPEQQRFPRIAAEIAQRLLAAGRAEEALAFLTRATPDRSRWPEMSWEHSHIAALQALGRSEEAQAARWNCFERCLDGSLLRAYLDQLPAFEDVEAEQRAIAIALAYPSLTQSLCFLLSWPSALAQTAELVVNRRGELEGAQYGVMGAAAEKLSQDHPLAATLALRSMVDFTLAETRSSRYGHAARHLQTCALLSQRIDAWGDIPSHEAYMAAIRSGHGRKSAFWQRMRELGQS
ncbi:MULTISPECIES: DUF6880 family protein [Aphanothece]|uniref:DUF6880 family protein n=1 Tax=Aphanothece TaxID=1121 RepID=UPI003984E1D6